MQQQQQHSCTAHTHTYHRTRFALNQLMRTAAAAQRPSDGRSLLTRARRPTTQNTMCPMEHSTHQRDKTLPSPAPSMPELLSKFKVSDADNGNLAKISGIDVTTEDNILITDSWNRMVTIYDQAGGCVFTKNFDHNVWDCASLRNGYFAVLADDCIKVFSDTWSFRNKIPVKLPNPRQLTTDSDGFFIISDAECKNVATYHAKTGSLLSVFPTAYPHRGHVELARQDSDHFRRSAGHTRSHSKHSPMGTGLAVNSKDLIYIADADSSTIKVFTHYGAQREDLSFSAKCELARPKGLCIGASDGIIVADSDNDRVVRFSKDWSKFTIVLDKYDGLVNPVAVAMTATKSLVIVDGETNVYIVKFD